MLSNSLTQYLRQVFIYLFIYYFNIKASASVAIFLLYIIASVKGQVIRKQVDRIEIE